MSEGFFYPKRKDVLDIDPSDIITRVQPSIATATGRKYTLSKKEVCHRCSGSIPTCVTFLMVYDIQLTPGGYCVNKQSKSRRSTNGYWFFNWVLQSIGSFLHQTVKHRALWIVAATS